MHPDRRPPVATPEAPRRGRPDRLVRSRRLARVMDDLVTVPGTRIGIGLDALIGLIPGIGDVIGSTLSGAIVLDAIRHRVPVPVLARMGFNLLLDAVLGLVPTIGDLLDVAHRANRKNLRLLERALAEQPDPRPVTPGYLFAAIGLVVVPLVLGLVIGLVVLWLLVRGLVDLSH
jgi:hypothetical protein